MRCIAVLDLRAGQVVHAVRGQRDQYQPVRSCLTPGADPVTVADALREQLGIDTFYVADLDAIQQQGSARITIETLLARHHECDWWIDAGVGTPAALESYLSAANVSCVIGSESLASPAALDQIIAALPRRCAAILSLDRRAGACMGPATLWADAARWPATVIAMNLDRVGAAAGPDLPFIDSLRRRAPRAKIVAAGGVRDRNDLAALANAGVSAALLATALHQGRLGRADLVAFQRA